MSSKKNSTTKVLTLFGFFALTASMVMTVYEYPSFATSKLAAVFFTILGGVFWFLPTALVSAEMASVKGWEDGGVFGWVSHSLRSEKLGFFAVFFQWFQITVGFVTMSYFIIGILSYVFNWPALNNNPLFKFLGVLIVFGTITLLQLGGTKYTAKIAQWGFVGGIIITSIVFFGLAITYLAQGNPVQISFSWHALFPNFHNAGTLTIFATFILAFTGVEASASHVNELQNAEKNYPLAIIMLVVLAIVLDAAGGLSVAAVIPQKTLSLNGGIYQTFKTLLFHFNPHLTWLLDILVLMIVFGVVAEIGSWVVGPSRGIQVATEYGLLPQQLRKKNKHGVPVVILAVQAVMVTIWDAILTFGGGKGNISFLVATTLTTLLYLVCYFCMYIAYFVLIFKHKKAQRTYNVPGGTIGKVICGVCGTLTSIFAFVVSFIPSSALPGKEAKTFQIILVICFIIALIIPFILTAFQKQYIKNSKYEIKHFDFAEEDAEEDTGTCVEDNIHHNMHSSPSH